MELSARRMMFSRKSPAGKEATVVTLAGAMTGRFLRGTVLLATET